MYHPVKKNDRSSRRSTHLLVAAVAALSQRICADNLIYVAPGGNWSQAANWSEQYVPAAGDVTNLLNSGSMNTVITFDNAAPVVNLSSNTIDYTGADGGSVTFSQSVNTFDTTIEYIGLNGTGLMSFTGGTHTITGAGSNALYVGYNVGSSGTVTLNGAGASLNATDSIYVGYSGSGVFNQFAGSNSLGGYLVLGGEPTGTAVAGTGTYNLTGGSLTANTLYAGLTGKGNFVQTGGNITAGALTSGYLPGSSGTVSLGGSGSMDVTGAMIIGDQGNGVFTQSGGFDLNSGLIVGNSAGGFGTMVISGGTMWCEGVSVLGSRGNATVLQNGGTISQFENLFLAVAAGGVANYSLSNGGTLHVVSSVVNGTTFFGGEYIGYQGPATFNQSGGSHIIDVYFYLGAQPGGSGTYNLSGGALICPAQNIGGGGTANDVFNQTGGSNIANSYVALGWLGGTRGTYNFSGGTLNIGGGLYDGYKGTGSFSQSAGTASTGRFYLGYAPFSSGFYTLSGGSLNVSTSEDIGYQSTGIFTQTGGTHTVAGTATITLSSLSGGVGTYNLQGGTLGAGPMINNGAFNLTGGAASLGALSGSGTLSIASSNAAMPSLTVAQFTQQSITIGNHGTLAVQPSNSVTNNVNALSITGSGQLNLANQSLVTTTSPSTIRQYLINGYNGGAWNGTGGLISSSAAANTNRSTTLGYISGTSSFALALGLTSGQTLVKYAVAGDANLDGRVDITDLDVVLNNYLKAHPPAWDTGDFNYDGRTDITDLDIVLNNYLRPISPSLGARSSPAASAGMPPGTLQLTVNTLTGDVQLHGDNAQVSSLQITSDGGSLAPINWDGWAAHGDSGWATTVEQSTAVGEYDASFNSTGSFTTINGDVDLGNIFNVTGARDLVLEYGRFDPGSSSIDTVPGSVTYIPEPSIILWAGVAFLGLRRRKQLALT